MNQELTEVTRLINDGALFVINHSGGKDSQAMMIELLKIVPKKQLLVIHATLGEVEWEGALEHAKFQAEQAGVPFIVAEAVKTLIDMVEHRFSVRPDAPSWPSASNRQCTSDLKRGPIEREVRRYMKANGFTKVANCMGLRAAESHGRAKLAVWKRNERNSIAGRDWYDWLPIHGLSTAEVFALIAAAGQQPHWAYAAGNERLSCVFCIMASGRDLANGAKHNPVLFKKYVELEQRTGYTMHMSRKSLVELVSYASNDAVPGYETEPCDLLAASKPAPLRQSMPPLADRWERFSGWAHSFPRTS
ncbi:MAG: phosphoadenosine phosphosulfate reductase family protein [Sulfuritalea sp.]|nr:phosphoadenosine phosphosulfate reductase family protein [Sulfuritalea sp.]